MASVNYQNVVIFKYIVNLSIINNACGITDSHVFSLAFAWIAYNFSKTLVTIRKLRILQELLTRRSVSEFNNNDGLESIIMLS